MNEMPDLSPLARPRADGKPGLLTGPAGSYAALALVANLVVIFRFALDGWGTLVVGLGLALGLLCIFGRMRLATPLFLAWVLIVLVARDEAPPSRFAFGSQNAPAPVPWLLETAVMVFLIAVTRLHALKVSMFAAPRDSRYFWTRLWHFWRGTAPKPSEHLRDAASCSPTEHWTVLLWAVFWMLVAGLILAIMPAGEALARFYGLNERTMRAVTAAWLLVLLPASAAGALALARWRRLGRREAGVYLRSVLLRWNAKEQRAIGRYAARRLRRRK